MSLPSDITGLVAWYKGESGRYDATSGGNFVTADGGSIARWEDQSGNGNHATQATSGKRLKKFGNFVVGEYGGDSFFDLPAVTIDQQSFSIFFVVELTNLRGSFIYANTNPEFHTFFECATLSFLLDNTGKLVSYGGTDRGGTTFVPSSRSLVGMTSGASNAFFVVNAATSSALAAAPSGSSAGGRIMGYSGAVFPCQAAILDVMLYNKQLSAGEISTLQAYAQSRGAVFVASADRNAVVSGDSISAGAGNTLNQNWLRQTTLTGSQLQYNNSLSGVTLAGLNTEKATRDDGVYLGGIPNILFISAGSNDIATGTSAATIKATLSTYGTAEKSTGFKVVVATVLPRTDVTGSLETARTTYNASVQADFGIATVPGYADGIMDWAADPVMGPDATNPTYYFDVVHPTDAGSAILAKYAAPFVASTGFGASGTFGTVTVGIASGGEFRGQMAIHLAASAGTITATAASGTITGNGTNSVTVTPAAGTTSFTYVATNTATITYTNGQGWTNPAATSYVVDTTPPTVTAASINTDGDTLTLTVSESSTGHNGIGLSGGASLTYISATSTTISYSISPTVKQGQTRTLSYIPGDIADDADNAMEAFSGADVTNDSTVVAAAVTGSGSFSVAAMFIGLGLKL